MNYTLYNLCVRAPFFTVFVTVLRYNGFMRHFILLCASIILAALSATSAWAAESEPVDTGKVVAQLVSSHDAAAPGQTIDLALRTVLDDQWHTYWRNPGDSGEPVQMSWVLPDGARVDDILWPLPYAIPTGPIVNYGFEGAPMFPVRFTLPAEAAVGSLLMVELDAYYLVCKDICIPESGQLFLQILVGEPVVDERWNNMITLAKQRAPKIGEIRGGIEHRDGAVTLSFDTLPDGDFSEAFFFPYDQGVVLPASPQNISGLPAALQLSAAGDFLWEGTAPETLTGVLGFKNGERSVGEIVTLKVGDDLGLGFVGPAAAAPPAAPVNTMTLWGALIGAFIGGLILNLMPCVFPVISIKALSLTQKAHGERSAIRKEGWLYTAGVVATFMVLTGILLAVKAAGADIGWGFQLQSPIIVGLLALLLFAVGLNLLGLFEVGSGLQNTGGGLAQKDGALGAFFTGVLAVIVATPCTAPFMAPAIGFAFVQPTVMTVAIFMALAIGFALPFLALSYAPNLLRMLPKPGPWMVRFKEFLAFPMLLAAVWLVWVLSLQSGDRGVGKVLISMVLIGFAIWALKGRKGLSKALAAAALIGAIALPFTLRAQDASASVSSQTAEVWSPARITELQAEGKNVFVDFTAAWCVSCKVNERLVLDTDATRALFAQTNTVKMIADWTNKDDAIAQELARHGRSGVPLYLVYRADGGLGADNNAVSPQILPQVLSQSVLREALQ